MSDIRSEIISTYSEWCAFSALKSGKGHLKSKEDVYPLIHKIDFDTLLAWGKNKSNISDREFLNWHEHNTIKISGPNIPIGWATKLINVYLKTRVYVASEGYPDLQEVIHPPIDTELVKSMRKRFKNNPQIISPIKGFTIKGIDTYDKYLEIINSCRLAAQQLGCKLIEVEQLWKP